uniref:Uncharacterized protein n=1 Tax=Cacopsylla melanoneura TaxID=428564 RepID=A0A8D8YT46_9HEMI
MQTTLVQDATRLSSRPKLSPLLCVTFTPIRRKLLSLWTRGKQLSTISMIKLWNPQVKTFGPSCHFIRLNLPPIVLAWTLLSTLPCGRSRRCWRSRRMYRGC